MIDLTTLNQSELLELVRLHTGARFKQTTPQEYLIQFLERRAPLNPEYVCGTTETRARLERWILSRWEAIESQLPCKGPGRGHCSTYPCADGRHLDCWLANREKML